MSDPETLWKRGLEILQAFEFAQEARADLQRARGQDSGWGSGGDSRAHDRLVEAAERQFATALRMLAQVVDFERIDTDEQSEDCQPLTRKRAGPGHCRAGHPIGGRPLDDCGQVWCPGCDCWVTPR